MATPTSTRPSYEAEIESRGGGWVMFAGTMLMIVGVLNFIYGIAAVSNSKFYVHNTHYVISSLHTWGWVAIILGALQVFASFSIWNRTGWGRWVGIPTAGLNAIAQMLAIPAYPFLSLALFGIDILIIYALVVYGGRQPA